jgi:hypothetical protein
MPRVSLRSGARNRIPALQGSRQIIIERLDSDQNQKMSAARCMSIVSAAKQLRARSLESAKSATIIKKFRAVSANNIQ